MRVAKVCLTAYILLLIFGFISYTCVPWTFKTVTYVSSRTKEEKIFEESRTGWEITYRLYLQLQLLPQLFRVGYLYVYPLGLLLAFIALLLRSWVISFFAGILMGFSIYDFHNTVFPLLKVLEQPLPYMETRGSGLFIDVILWEVKDYTILMGLGVTLTTISTALFTFLAPILIAKSR